RLRKLRVYAIHRGAAEKEHLFTIDRFLNKSSRQHTFEQKDKTTGISKTITIYDYFAQRYNQRLQFPDLPVVQMTKKNIFLPMELCKLAENQRYLYKLGERQTSNMIKFAVTPPSERWAAVEHGLGMLDWKNDKYLHSFGLQIDPTQVKVKGRLLPNPKVQFASGPFDPRTSGRWDLKGKKFLTPNTKPLKSWGICVIQGHGAADKAQVENFIKEFIKIYTGHGGRIENKTPVIIPGQGGDAGKAVEVLWNKTGNASQLRPQMLVFIVPDKDTMTYNRIKKSCECRYGVVSQVMQAAHVQKCQAQYISNVCMKFNAKLGGVTARAAGKPSGNFPAPTLVIGADVSHAAPGSEIASMAAITVSTDALATRYAAACETNGHRVEMISTNNITTMLKPLIQNWVQTVGKGKFPERIYYFRDGVSDGQYQHVLQQEVHDMKELLSTAGQTKIKFTVLVASKRHHVRFFPKAGDSAADRNGNPLPGTLVETGVTHPFEYDFYLCAHAALKGTARPVHYHVLLDENKLTVEELQSLIYEHSYQYIRSTTPVSLFPAVYYAHLASNRARSHENAPSSSGPESKGGSGDKSGGSLSDKPLTEAKPLIEMPNNGEI
ncbi:Protein argonaute, partial [Cryomyces antarcticus]